MSNTNYDWNDPSINTEGFGPGFPAGITEDCTIESISIDTTKDGTKKYFKVEFKAPNGGKINLFEFPVEAKDASEDVTSKIKNQVARIKHIVLTINPQAILPMIVGNTNTEKFYDMVNKVLTICPVQMYSARKFRILASYDSKNYVAIPKMCPFIEDGMIDVAASKLRINPKFHSMTPTAPTATSDLPTTTTMPAGEYKPPF